MAGSSARSAGCMLSQSRAGLPLAAGPRQTSPAPKEVVSVEPNLFAGIPSELPDERIDELAASRGLRIERIVSTRHASPPGFWYDQPWSEWVVVLSGSAGLLIEGEAQARELRVGDYLVLAPHQRHRVEWTDAHGPTVWLAVHCDPNPC